MSSVVFAYKSRESCDVCQFVKSSEKEYGVQCIIIDEANNPKQYSSQHSNVIKTITSGKPYKCVAFLQVSSPGKAFDMFDNEKYKIVILASAYFRLLEFFHSEFTDTMARMDEESIIIKNKKEWILAEPGLSFRGLADIIATLPLDSGPTYSLELVITRRLDINKTNIVLAYSDETMGIVNLPYLAMVQMARQHLAVVSLNNYKDIVPAKKPRQS